MERRKKKKNQRPPPLIIVTVAIKKNNSTMIIPIPLPPYGKKKLQRGREERKGRVLHISALSSSGKGGACTGKRKKGQHIFLGRQTMNRNGKGRSTATPDGGWGGGEKQKKKKRARPEFV